MFLKGCCSFFLKEKHIFSRSPEVVLGSAGNGTNPVGLLDSKGLDNELHLRNAKAWLEVPEDESASVCLSSLHH